MTGVSVIYVGAGSKDLVRQARERTGQSLAKAFSLGGHDLMTNQEDLEFCLQSGHMLRRQSGSLPLRGSIDLRCDDDDETNFNVTHKHRSAGRDQDRMYKSWS